MKIIAYCWSCNKEFDVSKWSNKYSVKCDSDGCEGFVISPSGKIQSRIIGYHSKKSEPIMKLL